LEKITTGRLRRRRQVLDAERRGPRLENPVRQHMMDVSRERVGRIVGPVAAVGRQPLDQRRERRLAGGGDVARERVSNLVNRLRVAAGEKRRDGLDERVLIEPFRHYHGRPPPEQWCACT
jgi:hypothetical protein